MPFIAIKMAMNRPSSSPHSGDEGIFSMFNNLHTLIQSSPLRHHYCIRYCIRHNSSCMNIIPPLCNEVVMKNRFHKLAFILLYTTASDPETSASIGFSWRSFLLWRHLSCSCGDDWWHLFSWCAAAREEGWLQSWTAHPLLWHSIANCCQ